jgi:NAD(P) transhydrogenase subunit alpha
MVEGMRRGSVIVDLAAESGGNCEATVAGETVDVGGVSVIGPTDLASMAALNASEMYARNLNNFAALMLKDGALTLDFEDDLIAGACLTHGGEIRHAPTRTLIDKG